MVKTDLLILDDILPSAFSPFRTLEYGHYLEFFDARLLSSEDWHLVVDGTFDDHLAALPIDKASKLQILRLSADSNVEARLGYVTFFGNAVRHFGFFEKRGMPFILQLYPGGGFEINQPEKDRQLSQILGSPLCVKVITTQTLTRDYLLERLSCPEEKIEFIYGGVFQDNPTFEFHKHKQFYPSQKNSLDISFVAHKYSGNITSKGYDLFVAIAQRLLESHPQTKFHVVGGYSPADVALSKPPRHLHSMA